MPWPTPQDYNEAIQNPHLNFSDPELSAGKPELMSFGPLRVPRPITGGFASVYRMHCSQRDWAVRCFLREMGNRQVRYAAISRHLTGAKLPYTVGFDFLPKGIRIRGQWYPILKMEWVQGETLDVYIQNCLGSPATLRSLADRWVTMIKILQQHKIAHGDLQHGNVIVANGDFRLIDYDGMFVPSLAGQLSPELGLPHYQHRNRTEKNFDLSLDNFSAWVIYISLLAIGEVPSLWQRFHKSDEYLLLGQEDFKAPHSSQVFKALERVQDKRVQATLTTFRDILSLDLSQIPSLDQADHQFLPPTKSYDSSPWWKVYTNSTSSIPSQTTDEQKKEPRPKPIPMEDEQKKWSSPSPIGRRMLWLGWATMVITFFWLMFQLPRLEPKRDPSAPQPAKQRMIEKGAVSASKTDTPASPSTQFNEKDGLPPGTVSTFSTKHIAAPQQLLAERTIALRTAHVDMPQPNKTIPKGTHLTVHEKYTSPEGILWYYVSTPENYRGWVEAHSVAAETLPRSTPSSPIISSLEKKPEEIPQVPTLTVPRQVWAKEGATIYLENRRNSVVNGKVSPGTALEVRSAKENWYFVAGENDRPMGWIEARYVTTHPDEQQPLETPPRFEYHPLPMYPLLAKQHKLEGVVTLSLELLADGTVGDVKITSSSGHPILDATAQNAVRHWTHTPAKQQGIPVTRWVEQKIPFKLDHKGTRVDKKLARIRPKEGVLLRLGASANSPTYQLLSVGTIVEIIDSKGDWYFVTGIDQSFSGWVHARDLFSPSAKLGSVARIGSPLQEAHPEQQLVNSLPRFVHQPQPKYPLLAKQHKLEGVVTLSLELLADGMVGDVKITSSSGHPILDATAQNAVRHWTHTPAEQQGIPVTRWVEQKIAFKLDHQ